MDHRFGPFLPGGIPLGGRYPCLHAGLDTLGACPESQALRAYVVDLEVRVRVFLPWSHSGLTPIALSADPLTHPIVLSVPCYCSLRLRFAQ